MEIGKINLDHELISKKIAEVEKITSAEIVPALFKASDAYLHANHLSAFIISVIGVYSMHFLGWEYQHPAILTLIYLVIYAFGYLLGYCHVLKRLLVTKRAMKEEVKQRAYQVFFENNLQLTEQHAGVLIFISVFERKIEIVCDKSVNKKINENSFDEIIKKSIPFFQKKEYQNGTLFLVEEVGQLLGKVYPRTNLKQQNEISDKIILE